MDVITFEGTVWSERSGPCMLAAEFKVGPHMADGGWTRRGRETEQDPPLICDACMERLRSMGPPDEPQSPQEINSQEG